MTYTQSNFTMTFPSITSIVAAASLITAVKSGWELSGLIKSRRRSVNARAVNVSNKLKKAFLDGYLSKSHFEMYQARLWKAVINQDSK